MAGPPVSSNVAVAGGQPASQTYGKALALLASLLRSVFELSYFETTIIESVWFIAYGVMGMPCAFLIERIGYKKALILGLAVMALGALGMIGAAELISYEVTLLSLFVIASGITLLQVAANPYVAVIGPPETSESRLTLVQAFNSMGTFFAPYFGGYLILSRTVGGTSLEGTELSQAERIADAQATQLPYFLVAVVLVIIAVIIWRANLPQMGDSTRKANREERKKLSLWSHKNLVYGIPAIFIYLIAEIGVANLFINFAILPEIGGITPADAAKYLTMMWGGMMVGRFAGSFLMSRLSPSKVLAGFALFALIVMVGVATLEGQIALWCLILVGLGHSIMFPAIFALGIKGLGPLTEEASGLLITAIAGGALVAIQGLLADWYGLQNSFWLTVACEVYVLWYALYGSKPTNALPDQNVAEDAVVTGEA